MGWIHSIINCDIGSFAGVTMYVSVYVEFSSITGPSYYIPYGLLGFFIAISPNQTSWKGTFAYKNCMLIQRMQKRLKKSAEFVSYRRHGLASQAQETLVSFIHY